MPLGSPIARSFAVVLTVSATAVCPALAAEQRPAAGAFGEPFLLNENTPAAPAVPRIGRSSPIALPPFQPAGVSTRIRRALLQYEALVADEAWDEAIELIETLQTESGDQLTKLPPNESSPVETPDEHLRYVPLRERCQELLASMPPAGVEAYRDRVDRTARQRLDAAIEALDEGAATRVAQDFHASGPAPDALLAAAELALQRGDAAAARRHLEGLHPLTRDPYGRPAAASLAQLRTDLDPARLAEAWLAASPAPGADVAADDVAADDELLPIALARLALASLSEGDTRRAAAERRLLDALTPGAIGRLAGRQQPLGPALESLIDASRSARQRPGAPRLGGLTWAWAAATPVAQPAAATSPTQQRFAQVNGILWQRRLAALQGTQASEPDPAPTTLPVASGLSAFYVEEGALKRLRLTDGEVTDFKLPGLPDEPKEIAQPAAGRLLLDRRQVIRIGPNGLFQQVTPATQPARQIDPALTVSGGWLFARVLEAQRGGRRRGAVAPSAETLLGVDPERPSVAAVRLAAPRDPENATLAWQFGGPPVVRGERLFVAMADGSGRMNLGIACYSITTGRRLWFTELGSGGAVPRLGGGATASVTPAGDSLYVATELGAVAALEAVTGRVRWIALHPRDAEVAGFRSNRTPATARPCHVVGDQVIAAPSGSSRLYAWDAASGRPLWDAARSQDASIVATIPSADGAAVVLAGRQVTAYDTLTGRQRLAWPESAHAGLRGIGAATVVGGEVFWPTRDAIYAIDPIRGGFTRPPIDVSSLSAGGANLVATDAGLLVSGTKSLRLLADPENPEPNTDLSRLMDGAPRRLAADQSRN